MVDMASMGAWCFQCGLEYAPDVAECVECGVPTVAHPRIDPDEVAADGGAQVAYELHGWNGSARAAVATALHADGLVHTWQGPTLLVRESDEERVDEIIEEIDDSMPTSIGDGVELEGGRVGFDLGARSVDLQEAVGELLDAEGIEFELLHNGFLLVATEVEDHVGDLIEKAQEGLRDSTAAPGFGPGVDGVDELAVVETLFLSADVLRRSPRDPRARRELVDAAALAARLSLPFGYEAPMWRSVLDTAASLASHLESDADDGLVESDAATLRDILHPYV